MKNTWYSLFKNVIFGPALRVWNRPWARGMDNVPATGPVIVASNHQAVMDSFFFPLMCPREITFLAKSEYFTSPGLVGRAQRWFFTTVGQIPVYRTSATASDDMIAAATKALSEGEAICIYPEGTRSPDGRVYRGRTGMARLAMETGHPVVPVAMFNTREANPIGTWIPRPKRVGMVVAEPIDPHAWAAQRELDPAEHSTQREFTDFFMHKLAKLAKQPYVDVYATKVKESMEAGNGYPAGAEKTPEGN
ncbi:acyl-phosphate glycerol 3-phosphate acyltransferase [Corynebacterium phocae]|uniref:Acyl-phosphate glycerol 3-phosphate acyltransferase n=1 Tax=Corynebacterium phocae TaxID=161895 RepID=A0A1L7D296_9CORY|nr:lysophospholipid acyltransferase family protein [Corynebacterium phocae]APT92210.1 acyl-phosphate glycerol 3-phosphate acyltransferase [Corynebacterium phocae]KAA8725790.1 1-acyl-sn-glycerol-3-phosphate acyltransferase [Corynebacterium phocae]